MAGYERQHDLSESIAHALRELPLSGAVQGVDGMIQRTDGRKPLTARHKLNSANLLGCTLLAGVAGGVTGSWSIFCFAAALLVGLAVHQGDIRLSDRR